MFAYDCRNRLVKAGDTSYEYDAENNRTAVTAGTKRTEYVVNSQPELSQVLQSRITYGEREETTYYFYGKGLLSQENVTGGYLTYRERVKHGVNYNISFCTCSLGNFNWFVWRKNNNSQSFFKGFIVEAEVIEMLDFSMLKKHIFVTIVKYRKYDMVVKTFVFSGKKDKIGDTIQIFTNGDITVRTKFYWKKDNSTVAGILFFILTILMIWLIIECIEIVKLQHLLLGMIVVIVALFLQPLLYGLTYRDAQSHIHMVD